MLDLLPLLKGLISLPGLSGYESPVCDLLEEAWGPLTDEIHLSRLGSLHALLLPGQLVTVHGRVSDSGKGRRTVLAAVSESVPPPVISAALFSRFSSRGENEFIDKFLPAMHPEFNGHCEE